MYFFLWKLFTFFSRFFRRNSTLWNMKVAYTFSKVLLKKLNLCKIWKLPSFFLGFFKDTQSNFVFLFKVLEFSVLGFLFIVMEKARPLNITCRCFPLHIYTFIQALLKYSYGEWIRGIRWRWKNEKPSNMLCIFFSIVLLLFECLVCVHLSFSKALSTSSRCVMWL
jgi:hypothetical protein